MNDKNSQLAIGSLLHDIGKVIQRATQERKTHATIGANWLKDLWEPIFGSEEILPITQQVRYHHAKALNSAKLPDDNLAYITYFADNISSGTDRRPDEDEQSSYYNFDTFTNSEDIFNVFGESKTKRYYEPNMLENDTNPNFPTSDDEHKKYSKGNYADITEQIKSTLQNIKPNSEYTQSILNLLESTQSYVPSSTNLDEVRDISLYDHSKLVSAFAQAILYYFEEIGETDYKKRLFTQNDKSFYNEKAFLMFSYDFSGIQDFIYTISTSGAQQQLRSRSFYLDMMSENIIDTLFKRLDLNRSSLIYSGGGHAYAILPNTQKAKEILDDFEKEFNQFLINTFGTQLYVAFAVEPFAASDVMLGYGDTNFSELSKRYQNIYHELSKQISQKKLHRYSFQDIKYLNSIQTSSQRECKICHSTTNIKNGEEICNICKGLNDFSSAVQHNNFFTISSNKTDLPIGPNLYLDSIKNESDAKKLINENSDFIVYSKNQFMSGANQGVHLWVGDYHKENNISNYPALSTGIKRMAIARLDVDNLGEAFVSGFNKIDDGKYQTIGRSATFSRSLSLFFKLYINKFADGKNVTIVYSGGDDVFAIGSWNDVINFVIEIREKFIEWTNNKLKLSAGIGIYNGSTPVNIMARTSGELESFAKDNGKNSITLFDKQFTFTFDEFINDIYDDKLKIIRNFFNQIDEKGKAFIYKMLDLIRQREDKINLARMVYLLSRTEHFIKDKEKFNFFKENIISWYQDSNESKQLELALMLYVYEIREE
jgi:CRISPR-associated protein Csm1